MLKNSPNLFADYIEITTRLNFVGKGVSDLELLMNFFALPGRSCENYNFCFPVQTAKYCTRAIITRSLYTFYPLFEAPLCMVTFGLTYG